MDESGERIKRLLKDQGLRDVDMMM